MDQNCDLGNYVGNDFPTNRGRTNVRDGHFGQRPAAGTWAFRAAGSCTTSRRRFPADLWTHGPGA